jgi:glycosyltransferase involved in cell wall biosynthesis
MDHPVRRSPTVRGKNVLVIGSFAPSLLHFRGPLIQAILAQGHRVTAAAPEMEAETGNALAAMGATPAEVALSNASLSPSGLVRSLSLVRKLIRETKPDLIFAYTIKPVILGAFAGHAERVPIASMITGAGYAFTGGPELKRLISRVAATQLYRAALKRSTAVIFQNRDDEQLFRDLRLVRPDRETHIVNGSGIDLRHFAPVPLPDKPAFLMIARLLKDKGIREFAEAAKRLKSKYPYVPIALVGFRDPSPDSLSEDELDELIRCGVDFKGHLADVRPAIAGSSVYVLPSYREGTPRSVLEAMAMGRAIITTDAPGCRETVRDGENGFLVRARDSNSLYEAMERFVADPALAIRMGAESRRYAQLKYDVVDVNAKLLGLMGLSVEDKDAV